MPIVLNVHFQVNDPHLKITQGGAAVARRMKTGGKPAAPRLLKPIKPNAKRAAFLRFFLNSSITPIDDCMSHFKMTRQNVISYWTAIHRDHGIGYALANDSISPRLPKGATAANIFGVTS